MPPADSEMANQIFKDPYLFDFLDTVGPRREAEVEPTLMDHMIDLLLFHGKNKLVVEYSLSSLGKSIAVSDWKTQITESLPVEFHGNLPTIEEIEAELSLSTSKPVRKSKQSKKG